MNKNQVDNLIRFSYLFHKSHNNFIMCDPSYIKEKWDRYIGVIPNNTIKTNIRPDVIEWMQKWRVSEQDEIKHIVNFIVYINDKHFYTGSPSKNIWITSDLIILFDEFFGQSSQISNIPYNNLHHNLCKVLDKWIANIEVNRDYNLSLIL